LLGEFEWSSSRAYQWGFRRLLNARRRLRRGRATEESDALTTKKHAAGMGGWEARTGLAVKMDEIVEPERPSRREAYSNAIGREEHA
jgi:hypothetical protein